MLKIVQKSQENKGFVGKRFKSGEDCKNPKCPPNHHVSVFEERGYKKRINVTKLRFKTCIRHVPINLRDDM